MKFHWKPKQGLQAVMWNEAVKVNGADRDFHRRDLWDAIHTGNVVPGIDFTNDALLQGRNFSYPDTQLKRLRSPTSSIPVNAPVCPVHTFQQDGHRAMRNPTGRANCEPNSFGEGPREAPDTDFATDAFARCRFIGYVADAMPLFDGAGLADDLDEGCIAFNGATSPQAFIERCRDLRYWQREQVVDQT